METGQDEKAPPRALQLAVSTAFPDVVAESWVPLPLGRSNLLWRVETGAGALVVKLYLDRPNPLFPNDPAAERAALARTHGLDLAPQPLELLTGAHGAALVYRYVEGDPWRSGVAEVAALLHRVHAMPPAPGLRTIGSGSAALLAAARRILDRCPEQSEGLATLIAQLSDQPPVAPTARQVMLHGDPVPANILCTAAGLRLIDWQCPATGDPCEDIALFLSPSMHLAYGRDPLDAGQARDFIAAYPDDGTRRRYLRLAPFYHLRMAAYALWSRGPDDPGYQAECRAATRDISGDHRLFAEESGGNTTG